MSHPFFTDASDHPFFEGTSNELRQGTATGRASVEHENIAENIYKLEQLRDQTADPKRKAHLDNLIGNLKKQQTGWTRPVTKERQAERDAVKKATIAGRMPWYEGPVEPAGSGHGSDLVRGVGAGIAAAGPLAADMALTIPDLMGSDLAERGRAKLQENVATTREFFDPQGGTGLIGEFAGGIAAGAPAYGPVANLTGKALASAPVIGKVLKPILTGANAKSTAGRVASGAAGNVIAGAPINALQAAGIEGTTEDKLKVLGIGLGADAVFGGAMRQPVFRDNPQAPKTADIPARDEMIKRDAEILAGNQKAKADAAERKAKTKAKTDAREAWKKANPDKKWSDLSNEAKNEIYAKAVPQQTAPVEAPPTATEDQLKAAHQELARAKAELAKNPQDAQAAGLAQAMENIIAKNTPQTTPPKAPVGKSAIASMQAEAAPKLSPEVQEFMLRKDLQKRYAEAGLQYDSSKPVPQLTEELSAHLSNVRPKSPREELEYTIGVLKGRILESPHMAPLLTDLEAQLRAMGGTPTSTQAINAPAPQRSSRVPNPPTDAAQSIVGQPGAIMGGPGADINTPPAIDPQGSISGKADAPKSSIATIFDAVGKVLAEDVVNPIDLDISGRPKLVAPTGTKLNEELVAQIANLGYETVRTAASPSPTAVAPPTPAPLPDPTGTQPSSSPSALPAISAKYGKMTKGQLGKLDDKLLAKLDNMDPNSPEYAGKVADLQELTAEINRREQLATVKKGKKTKAEVPAEEPVNTRPYADLEGGALLDLRDQTQAEIEAFGKKVPKETQAAMDAILAEINGRKTGTLQGPDFQAPEVAAQPVATPEPVISGSEPPPIDPVKFRAAPSKLSNTDLDTQIDRIKYDIDGSPEPDKVAVFRKRLSALITEKTKRDATPPQGPDDMPPTPTQGIKLQSHPAVGAFLGGYATGYFGPGSEDMTHEERLDRAFMWGLGSAGTIAGANYLRARRNALRKPKISNLLPGRNQVGIEKVVYSMDEINPPDRPYMERMREFYNSAGSRVHRIYQNLFQSTEGLETFVERVGKKEAPAENNPFKLASLFGTWIARTEAFLAGHRPLTYVENGEPIQITNDILLAHGIKVDPETGGAPLTLAQVLELAEGDKYALGDLAVAYASLEGAGRGPVPMDVATREALIRSAHPKLRLAVKELRKYNIATALVLHKAGRLSLDGLQKMGTEDWYTPFHRIVEQLDRINATKRGKEKINAPNTLHGRKRGSKKAVLNPYEVSVDMTRRMLRAAEYGQLVESLVSTVEALPLAAQREILRPVNKSGTKAATIDQMLSGDALRTFMRTTKLSEADAKSLLAYVDDDTVLGKSGILTAYRNGQLHSYVIERPDIFEAMKSMMPSEIDMLWKVLGVPTRVAARGTVLNPIFAWNQAFMDNFLAAVNSKYGFRPGIDNIRGWYHSMSNSPQYQKMIDAGGPGSIAQLDYTNPNTALQALRAKGDNVIDTAVRNIKEMSIGRAYKAFLYPLMEAPRVGEYLRALDHGESTLQAVYAAHEVTGNLRMQGSLNAVRSLHQMTLFSRPALAGILKTVKELGVGLHAPEYNKTQTGKLFQAANRSAGKIGDKTLRTAAQAATSSRAAGALSFMTKGFAYIAVPSIALWHAQKDDEEINQLRRTTGGQRYWFIRLPDGTITKHRKPHVIGQIFGTTVENILDQLQAEDPEALGRWLEGMSNDVSVNMLPQIGVVPYSLWAGKSLGLNAPLTPRGDEAMSPALQGYDKASLPARVVADALAPLSSRVGGDGVIGTAARRGMSPAGADYVVGQLAGMLGQDGVRLIGAAMEYGNSGFLPPKEELPIIGRLVQAYPSMNVREVQTFYTRDAKVMQVAADLRWITKNKPDLIADFVEDNITQIQMAPVHSSAREDIANLRRAIDDLRRMPDKTTSKQYQKSVEAHFIKMIEERLRVANLITDGMRPR
jgi:hypothetical protein